MTRFFSLAAMAGLALSSMTTQALAIAGGPFDNGLPSAQLENGGVYQATLSLRNGNGYCYFTPDAQISPETLGQPQAGVSAKGTLFNRSVIYYKGVTYVGSAFGMSDPEASYLQCSINAGSELVNQQTQTGQGQGQTNTFNFNQNTASVANQIVASARNFTVNGNWEAKFTQTAPTRRFRGSGELVFLAPTAADAVSNLALQSYANFISAINAFFASGPSNGDDSVPDFEAGQRAIESALNAINPFLERAGVNNAFKNGVRENIQVRGVFKYLR
jgi:hypothetical protein